MKKLLIGIIIFITLLFGSLIGLSLYAASLITEEFIVHQLEGLFNARFELKEYRLSLLSGGDLEVEGLAIGPRDRFADQAVALQKRPPLRNKILEMERLDIHLDLFRLFDGVFYLKSFVLQKPRIRMVLYPSGSNNISPLFGSPKIVRGQPNLKQDEPESTKPKPIKKDEKSAPPLRAQDIPLAASLGEIGIKNGTVDLRLQQTGDSLRIEGLKFLVTDIEFDPNDLKNKNNADINFSMSVRIFTKSRKETGLLLLASGGRVAPFNSRTGSIDPNIVYQVAVKKKSYVAGFVVLEKLTGKLGLLKNYLGILKDKATLKHDIRARIRYQRGVVSVLNDVKLITKYFDLSLKKGARFYLPNASHSMQAELLASAADSQKALAALDQSIVKNLKVNLKEARNLRKKHFKGVIRNERIYLLFRSKGPFANPDVKVRLKMPDLVDLAKEVGTHLIKKEAEKAKKKLQDEGQKLLKTEGQKLLKKLF